MNTQHSMADLAAMAGRAFIVNGPGPAVDVEELRETVEALGLQLRNIANQTRSLSGRADAAKRDLTPAEAEKLDALTARFEATERELKAAKIELADAEREAVDSTPQGRMAAPNVIGSADPTLSRAARTSAPIGASYGSGTERVLAAFRGTDRAGFADLGDFARAVAIRDPRLFSNASGMQTQVGADGGFAVPTAFLSTLMTAAMEQEVVRPRALFVSMPSGKVDLPRFNDSDRSAGHVGLTGKATAEGATGVSQTADMQMVSLVARKQMVLVPTTQELIADSGPLFGQLLGAHMARAMAAKVDDVLLLGSGAGEPLGLVGAPCTVEVAKESGQAAATIVPRNLSKMVARLSPGAFGRSVWLAHSSVVAQLFVLVERIQNAAASDFVGGIAPGWFTTAPDGTMTLMGRPLVITDRLQPLGTVGDIVLADLSEYLVGQVGEARLKVDESIGFKEDEIWFRLTLRIDGQPMRSAAITPRRGSDTLSPFVKLATRA